MPSKVVRVSAGGFHTILQTEDGDLWVAGKNDVGSLGLGELKGSPIITKFTKLNWFKDNNIEIDQFQSGYFHNIAYSSATNTLYGWGSNAYGQLGQGDTNNRFEPTEITFFRDKKILSFGVGVDHTLVVTDYQL